MERVSHWQKLDPQRRAGGHPVIHASALHGAVAHLLDQLRFRRMAAPQFPQTLLSNSIPSRNGWVPRLRKGSDLTVEVSSSLGRLVVGRTYEKNQQKEHPQELAVG